MDGPVDDDLLAEVTDAALAAAGASGASHATVRVERVRTQVVVLRDGRLETAIDDTEVGTGVQLAHSGSFGFAGSVFVDASSARHLVERAVDAARVTAPARLQPFVLAEEPPHGRVEWSSPYRRDPVDVPLPDKVALLEEWSRRLMAATGVGHVTAYVMAVREDKYLADLAGTVAIQRRVRVHPQLEALSVTEEGDFEEMRTLAPPTGRGWEYLEGEGWDFDAELSQLPELLAEKLGAPSVGAGTYDLVIDPTNLWLTIHESIGHATELDRAMGYEAAFAGTSFATPDRLGLLQYGSPVMQVVGDRTTEHGLATVAIDDEGVAAQSFDIVRDGVLTGYQLDRAIAASQGLGRSNGCAFADSPLHVPIQRMANVSLRPAPGTGPSTEELISGVDRGIYVVGDKSWSIDMQRYNFQFTGQRFYSIRKGRLQGQVRDLAYQASTTEFWGAMEATGGKQTYLLAGAFNCGKGQPEQVAAVSHGCPTALVRGVRVLNTREESGR
ncbi:MAG: TldD/PmbA family protein [Acidimicrobiales bacterium]